MDLLKHGNGRMLLAAAAGLAALAVGSTRAAPALPSQGNQNLPPGHVWDSADQDPLFRMRSVTVNNRALSGIAKEPLNLPTQPVTTAFTYAPNPLALEIPLRFRCQLDGYEKEWHERSVVMRMMIRFIDASQRDIPEQVFEVQGESPGWNGSFTDSPWLRRKEVITVPDGAVSFKVVISSAGPPEAVGAFAIRNLVVFLAGGDTNGIRLIPPVKLDASKAAVEAIEVSPVGWGRAGIRPADARLLRYGPGAEVALAILDDHPQGHADWNTAKVPGLELTPGEKLTFAWEEVYSIGVADYGRADYTNLPAGLYRFRMEALDLMGRPTGRGNSRLVSVPVAAWKTPWFWVAAGVALFAVAAGSWRLSSWRRMKRQVQELERQRVLEQERFRIAQDIHDDLGARTAQISLLSSAAQERESLTVAEARAELGMVSRMSRELVAALYETVWAVSPENDHLDSLVSYVCQVADQMCAVANLKCRFEMPETPPGIFIAGPIRHNVIMAVKEAIHNVIKHGHATEIQVHIQHVNGVLRIQVSDNGCGFDPAAQARGNGLKNMERRMRATGGRCSVASQPGAGTRISIELPLPVS
jgi:signal transduction histidine kinase